MFGKDTLHCDPTGIVTALKHEKIVKVIIILIRHTSLFEYG